MCLLDWSVWAILVNCFVVSGSAKAIYVWMGAGREIGVAMCRFCGLG